MREDDTFSLALARVRHHFFDPFFDRPLTIETPLGSVALGERAPDWALEDRRTYATQSFSYRDARDAFAEFLTAPSASEREFALARTFKTLGHVIHLIQDMASPEHVRNDVHLPVGEHFSLFEIHVDRALDRLSFAGYPAPPFAIPREFWVSPDRSGTGLAEFTNRHFVTTDTNFASSESGARGGEYPSPVLDLSTMLDVDVQSFSPVPLRDRSGQLLEGTLTFFGTPVVDAVTGSESFNEKLTTLSFFDRDLSRASDRRVFTLNRFNVERAAEFLLPRAVGYSAGLLDYFFRGRLELRFRDDPTDATRALLTVVNRGQEAMGPGAFSVHVDDASGDRHLVSGGIVELPSPLAPNESWPLISLSGGFEAGPGSVVYRGRMGQEQDGVVGKVFGAAEVEQIFRGGADWALRSAQGIFPLGLGLGPSDVRWGERDNMLVARVDRGDDGIDFFAYRISRAEGERRVPLREDGKVDLVLTRLDRLGREPISLGTTLEVRNVTHFSQGLVTIGRYATTRTQPDGSLVFDIRHELRANETIAERDYALTRTIPLALAAAQPPDDSYSWVLKDFFLSRDGEVMLVVQVFVGSLPGFEVQRLRHNYEGDLVADPFESTFIDQSAPPENHAIFVMNLTRRAMVAATCDALARVEHERTARDNAIEFYLIEDRDGSVSAGYVPVQDLVPALPSAQVLATIDGGGGLSGITLDGVYRRELADSGFARFRVAQDRQSSALSPRNAPQIALVVTHRTFRLEPTASILTDLVRSNAPADGYVVLAAKESTRADGQLDRQWQSLQWMPGAKQVVPDEMPVFATPRSTLAIKGVHHSAVLATESGRDPVEGKFTTRTHFLSGEPPVSLDGDAGGAYRLFQPALAYNIQDQQFHRIGPLLAPLGRPMPLAPGGPQEGSYHVVGRR